MKQDFQRYLREIYQKPREEVLNVASPMGVRVPTIQLEVCNRITRFVVIGSLWVAAGVLLADEPVDFNRDIRPLFSNNCLACHGFDESSRSTELRLDTREGALADLGGYSAVVPGNPGQSVILARISGAEGVELMPPVESHKKQASAGGRGQGQALDRRGGSMGKALGV